MGVVSKVYDILGKPMFRGDYVECMVHFYPSIDYGQRRRIQAIDDAGRIELHNPTSPTGTSHYAPFNFRRASQHAKEHKLSPDERPGPFVAYKLPDGFGPEDFVGLVHAKLVQLCMATETREEMNAAVEQEIINDPDSRWFILPGNVVAERERPKVAYRTYTR